jgi:hypothetical protein
MIMPRVCCATRQVQWEKRQLVELLASSGMTGRVDFYPRSRTAQALGSE